MPIDEVHFVDGVSRAVYLDGEERQYVLDADGQSVYGDWVYIDEPLIVSNATTRE